MFSPSITAATLSGLWTVIGSGVKAVSSLVPKRYPRPIPSNRYPNIRAKREKYQKKKKEKDKKERSKEKRMKGGLLGSKREVSHYTTTI